MLQTVRGFVAMALWASAALVMLFLIFSGWLFFAPFVFASRGRGGHSQAAAGGGASLDRRPLHRSSPGRLTGVGSLGHNADPEGRLAQLVRALA